jgi:histidyl-tRNA synthetase
MVAGKRRELGFPLRWYSIPNVFRYERPQRGRLREHWQLNVDLFGSHSRYADAEIIGIAYGIMFAFGATEKDFVIKIGSRSYLDSLTKELSLSDEQPKKLLGVLDRRAKMPTEEFDAALMDLGVPKEKLSGEAPADIAKMIAEFAGAGINNLVWDPSVVRGFNYYTGIVFEVFDTHPDNNRALFGGGRYDNLTEMFDDEPIAGVGFGMGDVTIKDFLEVRNLLPEYTPATHVYIAIPSPELALQAQTFAGSLRQQGVNVAIDFGEKKLGDQIKVASKHKIPYVLVLGPDELALDEFTVRDLATGAEKKLSREQLSEFFLNLETK